MMYLTTFFSQYLHMAGRTGRNGKPGTVVTVADLEQMKRLQSWETPLGISFDVKFGVPAVRESL